MSRGAGDSTGADVLVVAEQLRRSVPGGIGTYVRGLLGALSALAPSERESIGVVATRVAGRDPLGEYGFPLSEIRLPARFVNAAWAHGLGGIRAGRVVHATSFALPVSKAPVAMMIHDLAFLHHPEAYPAHGLKWHETALRRAIDRVSAFVVPSERVRLDLIAQGVETTRVRVIREGADHLPPPNTERVKALLDAVGVRGPYLLSVSTLEPRKNLVRLIQAYTAARSTLPEAWPLVVVGPDGWGERIDVETAGVVFVGAVADEVLAGLYESTQLFCYVPLEEGFGLPVVEAMRSGVPVVSSEVPSAGGASILADPLEVSSIRDAIVRGATDPQCRSQAIAAGQRWASGLSWHDAALGHVALWRELMASST